RYGQLAYTTLFRSTKDEPGVAHGEPWVGTAVDLGEVVHGHGGRDGVSGHRQGGRGDVQGAVHEGDGVVGGGQPARGDRVGPHVAAGGGRGGEGKGASQVGRALTKDEPGVAHGEPWVGTAVDLGEVVHGHGGRD